VSSSPATPPVDLSTNTAAGFGPLGRGSPRRPGRYRAYRPYTFAVSTKGGTQLIVNPGAWTAQARRPEACYAFGMAGRCSFIPRFIQLRRRSQGLGPAAAGEDPGAVVCCLERGPPPCRLVTPDGGPCGAGWDRRYRPSGLSVPETRADASTAWANPMRGHTSGPVGRNVGSDCR